MTTSIIITVLIFASLTSEHVIIEVKIVLESIGNEYIVHILSQVQGHANLFTELILFLFVEVSFLGGHSVSEHVEERLSLDSLDDCASLVGLLMLLLLLDLLLGGILRFIGPGDGSTLNSLNLILSIGLVDNL